MAVLNRKNRFSLLFRKFWRENRKNYLLYSLGFFSIIFLIYGYSILNSLHDTFPKLIQLTTFSVGLLLGGTLFAASFYGLFATPAKAIRFLLLPVSIGEKLLLSYLFTQVIFIAIFLTIYHGIDWLFCFFYNHFVEIPKNPLLRMAQEDYKGVPLNITNSSVLSNLFIFILLSSAAHFGGLSFTKNAFIKTCLLIILFWLGINAYHHLLLNFFLPPNSSPHGIFFTDSLVILRQGGNWLVKLPGYWLPTIYWLLPCIIYISLWTGSYFKLKEKQI